MNIVGCHMETQTIPITVFGYAPTPITGRQTCKLEIECTEAEYVHEKISPGYAIPALTLSAGSHKYSFHNAIVTRVDFTLNGMVRMEAQPDYWEETTVPEKPSGTSFFDQAVYEYECEKKYLIEMTVEYNATGDDLVISSDADEFAKKEMELIIKQAEEAQKKLEEDTILQKVLNRAKRLGW